MEYLIGAAILAAIAWFFWPRRKSAEQRQAEAPFDSANRERVTFKVNGRKHKGYRVANERGDWCYYDEDGEFFDDLIEEIVFLALIDTFDNNSSSGYQEEPYANTDANDGAAFAAAAVATSAAEEPQTPEDYGSLTASVSYEPPTPVVDPTPEPAYSGGGSDYFSSSSSSSSSDDSSRFGGGSSPYESSSSSYDSGGGGYDGGGDSGGGGD